MRLPAQYLWLEKEKAPRILLQALRLYGVKEAPGKLNNPVIVSWAKEVGFTRIGIQYQDDDTPWCGLFVAVCAKRAGLELPEVSIRARQWLTFGDRAKIAMLGDVLVFSRPRGGGHVGIYVGEDSEAYHVLGGNQSDMVNIARIAKGRLLGARRTKWKVAQPPNVRVIRLSPFGELSQNEA